MSQTFRGINNFNSLGNEFKMTRDEKCKDLMVKSQTRNTAAVFTLPINRNRMLTKIPCTPH